MGNERKQDMINRDFFYTLSKTTQEELTNEPFSFRECSKCEDYFDLGGSHNNRHEQAMYLSSEDFECSDEKIINYQKKMNFDIDDNIFCWDCITTIRVLRKQLT